MKVFGSHQIINFTSFLIFFIQNLCNKLMLLLERILPYQSGKPLNLTSFLEIIL